MEIAPVPLAQIHAGRDGRQYEISGQAGEIVRRLREIEPSLRVVFNEGGGFFAVQQVVDRGRNAVAEESDSTQRMCVARVPAADWDDRVVRDFELRAHELRHGKSPIERLERLEREHHARVQYDFDQEVRERAYPLFRAFQRNIVGANPRAFFAARESKKAAA